MKIAALGVVVFAALVPAPALCAQNTDVARISVIEGVSVTVQRGDDQEQLAATVNTPLLPGDYVATAAHTRAEVQLDGFTMLRLGENVQIRIANNDQSAREVQLAAGSLILSIAHPEASSAEIDTPSLTLQATSVGDYRVTVTSDGATLVTARSGTAEVLTPSQSYSLAPGETLRASGSAANPEISHVVEVPRDGLDAFDTSRDRAVNTALDTDTYAPPSIAGYDDLNAYGNWIDVYPYGMVWNPYVPAGWAPYRNGSWVWEDGFGWTWIALEPWGWAPFHYGYWFYCAPNGWCWYPPGVAFGPVWYPAVVGWFGFGDYWGAMLGWQYWGWVPLWPYEPYYPWYPGWSGWHTHPNPPGPRRITSNPPHRPSPIVPVRTRAVYGADVAKAYRNLPYGATGVSGGAFRSGSFAHLVPIDAVHLRSVTLMRGALPMTPTASNLQFTHAAPKTTVHWAKAFSDQRFATAANLPRRTQFSSQQKEVHQAIHVQAHAIAPARPQTPPASEVWRQFESSRQNVAVPHAVEPHPYQAPVMVPQRVPAAAPHPVPISRPPAQPSSVHPSSRPPDALVWQTVVQKSR